MNKQIKRSLMLIIAITIAVTSVAQIDKKREFRGAWIHVINQSQYAGMNVSQMRKYFTKMLDNLNENNVNAVIFQVRPAADAFYRSKLEPWSRYLTGVQGKAPDEGFDPLDFMVTECHKRGMEIHAWMNPYRVTASKNDVLSDKHLYHSDKDRFVHYDNRIFFDPGLPQNRKFICAVVKDIVTRYDIDAVHFDDYFYPYPVAGERFDDDFSFEVYASRQGFTSNRRADWRRNNVNLLIEQVHNTIVATKPWVRFGISPFGIYRNKRSTADGSGSETNGLQNYDDLYADVILWAQKGWIDYLVPQIYWEIGYKPADYETLVKWWSKHVKNAELYIGQDIARTVKKPDPQNPAINQLPRKMALERNLHEIGGHCWWPGYEILNNMAGVADSLKNNCQRYPSLIPPYSRLHDRKPKEVKALRAEWTAEGYLLYWEQNGDTNNPESAQYYVVYRFAKKQKRNLNNPANIVAKTRDTYYKLPYENGAQKYKYVVTAVDRFHNESKRGKSKNVKL
ncbi:MAG: family 10 glycosylhydrolase [Dysgonamonadaceae bacterium]|jgi:uncharacterized lipoprotein YddW (UPF0748 family)|nr:family 10 glycosylhydrolase [Dysgonamonadaceae bacterium]